MLAGRDIEYENCVKCGKLCARVLLPASNRFMGQKWSALYHVDSGEAHCFDADQYGLHEDD